MSAARASRAVERGFWRDVALAVAGGLVFAIPSLMTMELWALGGHIDRLRLAAFLCAALPILVGMSYFAGFRPTFHLRDDLVDAFVAYLVGVVVAIATLAGFGQLEPGGALDDQVARVTLQAIGCAFGAMLARAQFGDERDRHETEGRERRSSYRGRMFFKMVGALVLSFSLAPTEEMILIAYQIGPGQAAAVGALSLIVLHGFMVAIEAHAPSHRQHGEAGWRLFARYSLVGYALVLLVSAAVLFVFGRLDDTGPAAGLAAVVVLALPASIGAGAARAFL